MRETEIAHRAQLHIREKSRQRQTWIKFIHQSGIMVRSAEKAAPATVTGAKQAGVRGRIHAPDLFMKQALELIRGDPRIPQLILQRLPHAGHRVDRDGTAFRVGTDDVANEKIAPLVVLQIFADRDPREKMAARLFPFGIAEFLVNIT